MLHTSPRREEERWVEQEPKTTRERAEDLLSLLVSDWRPTPRQGLWAIRIVIVLGVLIAIGYYYEVTLWDWAKLLIVPAVIAAGGLWFNAQQRDRELHVAEQRTNEDRKIAEERAETDREIAEQSRQDDTLHAYLDGMSQLLTDKELPLHNAQPGDSLSTVARARTLTVLGRLDQDRKPTVLQFLLESGLIYKEHTLLGESNLIERRHNILSLREADLSGVDLQGFDLSHIDLSGANLNKADLFFANLSGANLSETDLSEANLSHTDLSGALLSETSLANTDLKGANLRLSYSPSLNLFSADLRGPT